jgi:hypothetical protein
MHWDCYAVWEHRERFAKAHVRFWIENEKGNPDWARVFENERCFIVINPHPPVAQAHIMLFATDQGLMYLSRNGKNGFGKKARP